MFPSLAIAASVCALTAAPCRAENDTRTNFLIILCDDLGYGDLACYGNETIQTPNLDRLAAEGIRFTDCYASAPVCSPSRAGLLTGRTPNRTGVYDWIPNNHIAHLPSSEITIASLLSAAGYDTCHVGKWHLNGQLNSDDQPQPNDHGFRYWFSTQNNAAPSHENPRNFVRNGEAVGEITGFACQIVVDEAIGWLREVRDHHKPFFQFVCFHEPHEPIASPPELVARYPNATKNGEALYYANVTNMDRAVGRLIAAVDELGLGDDTLVFFTSDNGPETLDRYRGAWRSHGSPGPLRGMKLHVREGGIRVPGIARWTGTIVAGQTTGEPISGVDILPTLCELAGINQPDDRTIDGQSFAPILRGEAMQRRQPLFWSYYRALGGPRVALRDGGYKIAATLASEHAIKGGNVNGDTMAFIKSAQIDTIEMFDLHADLGETIDLASRAEFSDRVRALRAKLEALYRQVQREGVDWFADRDVNPDE